jgi:hypothetical protein
VLPRDSSGTGDMENGEIYKMELSGKIIGKFGTAGKLLKEFGSTHEIDCRSQDEIVAGEITNSRVQKLTLHSN